MDDSVSAGVRPVSAATSPSGAAWSRLSAATILVLTAACAQRARVPAPETTIAGYLVTGSGAAAFALQPGDTLPELDTTSVPEPVRMAAASQAKRFRYRPACTRYFRADSAYVALLIARCQAGHVVDDGEGMAVFTARGEPVGVATPLLRHEYTALRPERRESE